MFFVEEALCFLSFEKSFSFTHLLFSQRKHSWMEGAITD
jgi:hypothetical protein